jgi:hypothetical protein
MTRLLVGLAAGSALLVSIGAGLIYMPAGLIVPGVLGFGAVYVLAYLRAKGVRW